MNSVLDDMTDEVAALLNTATLDMDFVAEAKFVAVYPEQLSPGLKVFVMPQAETTDLTSGTRADSEDTYTVQIGIVNGIAREDDGTHSTTEVKAMNGFVQQVFDFMKTNRSVMDGCAVLQRIERPAVYDTERLEQHDTYTTKVNLIYRLFR